MHERNLLRGSVAGAEKPCKAIMWKEKGLCFAVYTYQLIKEQFRFLY